MRRPSTTFSVAVRLAAASKAGIELPLENYYTLFLSEAQNVAVGVNMMEELTSVQRTATPRLIERLGGASGSDRIAGVRGRGPSANLGSVDSVEGGLCTVGALGAAVFYGVGCGLIAMID